ncbi:MAG: hypothetical protein LOD92_04810, partial [Bacillales bacterium]
MHRSLRGILRFVLWLVMAIFVGCSQTTTEVASNGQQPGVTTEDVATEDSSYPEKPIELIVPYPPGANT